MCSAAVFAQAQVLQVEQRHVLCHVRVLTASVLVRRFLSLSGRIGTTLGLERRGTCRTSAMLDWFRFLVTRAYFTANWKSLVKKRRKELDQLPSALRRRQPHKLENVNVHHCRLTDLVPTRATGVHAFLRLDCTAHIPELQVLCV